MGFGMGYGMGHGPGYGHGYGPGYGQGYGDCYAGQPLDKPLSVEDARSNLEQRLQKQGNDRLKVGKVEDKDDKTIIAEIVTVDGSLVEKIEIDKATGRSRPVR